MASPKLVEFRKAEALKELAEAYTALKAQLDRLEEKIDALSPNKPVKTGKDEATKK